jgi:hypothetical protein
MEAAKLLQTPVRSRDAPMDRNFRKAYDDVVDAVERSKNVPYTHLQRVPHVVC